MLTPFFLLQAKVATVARPVKVMSAMLPACLGVAEAPVMVSDSRNEFLVLSRELGTISAKWAAIETEFTGPAPKMPCTSDEWVESTELNLVMRRDEDETGLRGFTSAWHRTITQVRSLLLGQFASWATRVVSTHGADYFQRRDIPDPPIHRLPLASRDTETATAWLTGTANADEAGCRIIFWIAAYQDARGLRRSQEITRLVFMWAGEAVDFHAPDQEPRSQGDRLGELFGLCYPARELMAWVEQGLVALYRCEATAVDHGMTSKYKMQKLDSSTIVVRFGDETGTIKGKQAVRLSTLIRQGRIDVLELAGDLDLAGSSGSVHAPSDVESSYILDPSMTGQASTSAAIRGELQPLYARLNELKHEIEDATSDLERSELEDERQQLQRNMSAILRPLQSQIGKAIARVKRGFRQVAEDSAKRMPNFANHIREAMDYDEVRAQFTYLPPICPEWEFDGFD